MQLPHTYSATATASQDSLVTSSTSGMPDLTIAPPANFGGPGDTYSPEDLQAAAIASCFILSFKAIASASKLDWESINVVVDGTLAQVARAIQFTEIATKVSLKLSEDGSRDKATRLLEKAEQTCFITNSMKAEGTLEISLEGGA